MRNLALLEIYSSQIPKCNITATVVDPEEGLLWAASERLNADSDLQVELWTEKAGKRVENTHNVCRDLVALILQIAALCCYESRIGENTSQSK